MKNKKNPSSSFASNSSNKKAVKSIPKKYQVYSSTGNGQKVYQSKGTSGVYSSKGCGCGSKVPKK